MYSADLASRTASLQQAQQKALSNLNAEKQGIAPVYYDKRNQASALSQQQSRNFAEFMASRGGTNSGVSAQAEMTRGSSLQGALGLLNREEAAKFADIERRRSDVLNNTLTQQQGIEADIALNKNNALINNNNTSFNQAMQLEQFQNAQEDRDTANYIKSITGLGDSFDYQGEINKFTNDNDPTNDWKIPYLQQERQAKIQSNLQRDIATIGQYSNDYQAEINKRLATPDTADDALIPYLKMARQEKLINNLNNDIKTVEQYSNDYQGEINKRLATPDTADNELIPYLRIARAQKIASQNEAQLSAQETQIKRAYDIFKLTGVATADVANILGIPVGTKTPEYLKTELDKMQTQYNINRPYYNPNSGSGKSSSGSNYTDADYRKDLGYYSDLMKKDQYGNQYTPDQVKDMITGNPRFPEGVSTILVKDLGLNYKPQTVNDMFSKIPLYPTP
jgi:hypothetical protein